MEFAVRFVAFNDGDFSANWIKLAAWLVICPQAAILTVSWWVLFSR